MDNIWHTGLNGAGGLEHDHAGHSRLNQDPVLENLNLYAPRNGEEKNTFTMFIEELESLTLETCLMISTSNFATKNTTKMDAENAVEVRIVDDLYNKIHDTVLIQPSDKLLEIMVNHKIDSTEINSTENHSTGFDILLKKIKTAFSQMKILLHFLEI